MDTEYLFDGSFDGFLTAVFYAYSDKNEPRITRQQDYVPNLLHDPVFLPTEPDKAERVYNSLVHKLSSEVAKKVYEVFLNEAPDCYTLALKYIKLAYQYGPNINLSKNNSLIIAVDTLSSQVTKEAHLMKGFIRFEGIGPLLFYAAFNPDHNVLPLISNHFTNRFNDQRFIIHDVKRSLALVYNLEETYLTDFTEKERAYLMHAHSQDPFEELFKSFFKGVTITERISATRQDRMLPRRYRKYMPEFK